MNTLMHRIGTKVQLAMASALIAGSLLAATPLIAGAQTTNCGDLSGDGQVTVKDLILVLHNFGQAKAAGGRYSAADIVLVVNSFGQRC